MEISPDDGRVFGQKPPVQNEKWTQVLKVRLRKHKKLGTFR